MGGLLNESVSRINNILDVLLELKVKITLEDDPVKHAALAEQYVKCLGHLFSEYRRITKDNIRNIYIASKQGTGVGLKAIEYLDMLLDDLNRTCDNKLNLN